MSQRLIVPKNATLYEAMRTVIPICRNGIMHHRSTVPAFISSSSREWLDTHSSNRRLTLSLRLRRLFFSRNSYMLWNDCAIVLANLGSVQVSKPTKHVQNAVSS